MGENLMRTICVLIILMIPTLISAQGRDSRSCASIDLNGYNWNGSTWERQAFATRSWRFTFAGNTSRQTINGQRVDFNCNTDEIIKQCSYHGLYFIFNTETGQGALADLFGVAINPDENQQAFVELVQCTRI